MMRKTFQVVLLALGVVALIVLLVEIGLSVAATTHGNTPARIVQVNAGPYALKVSLYKDPANAGFALPFAIAPQHPISGTLSYTVTSIPVETASATPVHASISADPAVPNGIEGAAEITVQGTWNLEVVVSGPDGQAKVDVLITASAPPPLPLWIGWPLGFIPLAGLLIFLLLLRTNKKSVPEPDPAQEQLPVA